MLAKLTVKNQITLPKALIERIAPTEYFDVTAESGRIVLTPMRLHKADTVREKLQTLDISQHDINEAITWARS